MGWDENGGSLSQAAQVAAAAVMIAALATYTRISYLHYRPASIYIGSAASIRLGRLSLIRSCEPQCPLSLQATLI